jgi:tetratricopeptide (TPR) repeat protein
MNTLQDSITAWLAQGRSETADLGADPGEVGPEARRLLAAISKGSPVSPAPETPERLVETAHAMVGLLTSLKPAEIPALDRTFDALETLLPESFAAHRDHLLSELALFGWREARARGEDRLAGAWRRRAGRLLLQASDGVLTSELGVLRERADSLLDIPRSSRRTRLPETHLRDPELLIALLQQLTRRLETAPKEALADAESFYETLGRQSPTDSSDDREYFLGEFALLAATACRVLFRRDDAHRWLARAEASCIATVGAETQACRFAFQKIALRIEERQHDEVLELAPKWAQTAKNLGLAEEVTKFLFLHAAALREVGRIEDAATGFQDISEHSRRTAKPSFEALAECNLVECRRSQGDLARAISHAEKAIALLVLVGDVHLAKHRWLLGGVLREQGRLSDALATYRGLRKEQQESLAREEPPAGSNRPA